MRSGLFDMEGLAKDPPCGFKKITEGTAALLFPPANIKGTSGSQHSTHTRGRRLNNEDNDECTYQQNTENDDQAVFYNPAQVVNRDLSVCVLACFSRLRRNESSRNGGTRTGITILEALSATGLRAIRYYKEISGVRFIIANDLDTDAVECIRRNCEFNGVPCVKPTLTENFPSNNIQLDETSGSIESGGAVIPNLDDANDLMFRLATNSTVYAGRRLCVVESNNNGTNDDTTTTSDGTNSEVQPLLQQELMDVVDLDPYGSVSPFLDAAMRCIKEGGLLLVTSTDSAILCGNYPDTCHAKYNTVPTKNAACHEMAVRILLAAVERVANKHRKYIVPLLSLHIDFYVRCFLRVYTQPAEVKLSPCKLGYLLQCSNCPSYWVRPLAVARKRCNKRVKREKTTSTKEEENKKNDISNDEIMEKETLCRADTLGRECFQGIPSRQDNPKITSCGFQHFPSFVNTHSCTVCGAYVTLSGPIYAAPTHSVSFLNQLLQEIEKRGEAKQITAESRVAGLVRVAMEELPDVPLFYQLPDIASFVKVRCPQTPLVVGALGRMGYRCSQVHCAPSGIKTDCPPDVLVSVMLQWKHEQNLYDVMKNSTDMVKKDNDNVTCMSTEDVKKKRHMNAHVPLVTALAEADFSYNRQFDFRSTATGVANFIPNAPNWGPKRRHRGVMRNDGETDDET